MLQSVELTVADFHKYPEILLLGLQLFTYVPKGMSWTVISLWPFILGTQRPTSHTQLSSWSLCAEQVYAC